MNLEARVYLDQLGDQAVERAYGLLGGTFFRDPLAARHPAYFYPQETSLIRRLHGEENGNGLVQLVGQGPLPIEFNSQVMMVRAAAFRIGGVVGHESLGIFSSINHGGSAGDVPLHVIVENHTKLVMQHEGGGSLWTDMHESISTALKEGGGVLLLPEYLDGASNAVINRIAKSTAHEVGLANVKILHEAKIDDDVESVNPATAIDQLQIRRSRLLKVESLVLPWSRKPFTHLVFTDKQKTGDIHHAWVFGEVKDEVDVPVRVHSACSSSEVFGAVNCDCPDQLDAVMHHIVTSGKGVLLYMNQEARGHGLWAKVQTWPLNIGDKIDLFTAFNAASLKEDIREFEVASEILKSIGFESMVMLSNNRTIKGQGLTNAGINITGWRSVVTQPRSEYCEIDHTAKVVDRGDKFDDKQISINHFLRRH
jgi:3,4-dihydroxy 2-butanone 4-phosphate synthase / GTP cyclohydrolase II